MSEISLNLSRISSTCDSHMCVCVCAYVCKRVPLVMRVRVRAHAKVQPATRTARVRARFCVFMSHTRAAPNGRRVFLAHKICVVCRHACGRRHTHTHKHTNVRASFLNNLISNVSRIRDRTPRTLTFPTLRCRSSTSVHASVAAFLACAQSARARGLCENDDDVVDAR